MLDTYANERRPVARRNGDESLANAANMFLIDEALGVLEDPRIERMQATLVDPEGRKRVEAAIDKQRRHFNLIGLQLGHTYGDGAAIVPDGSEAPAVTDPVCEFVPRRGRRHRVQHLRGRPVRHRPLVSRWVRWEGKRSTRNARAGGGCRLGG